MAEKQVFGDILAALRKHKGITQQQVANQIGVSKSAVYGFEKGRSFPVPDKLVKLARYFGVTVDYLLTGEEPPATQREPETDLPRTQAQKNRRICALYRAHLSQA